jgi:RNA polymerase sigma factor (sigma-70 family)
MMNSGNANPLFGILPKEKRLAGQAKSGDIHAFVELYDACVERVYRYVYFLVPNTKVAGGLTFQVFFKAWEKLEHYQVFNSPFISWLYSIAQDQIVSYSRTHERVAEPDDDFTTSIREGSVRKEFTVIRDGLQFLTAEQQRVLVLKFVDGMPNKDIGRLIARPTEDVGVLVLQGLQEMTNHLQKTELKIEIKELQGILEEFLTKLSNGMSILDECWVRYPQYNDQLAPLLKIALLLNLGRNVKPAPTFVTYTHEALFQHIWSHPRRPKVIITPAFQRVAVTLAVLVAFLVTGTARAQSALPGDPFYPWKRTSEQAWLALSPDPVSTDIILAERRLNEWIAVSHDSVRSTTAKSSYVEALSRLKTTNDDKDLIRVVSVLEQQQQTLGDAGLTVDELDTYLTQAVSVLETGTVALVVPTDSLPTDVVTSAPVQAAPPDERIPTGVVPAETAAPTEIMPAETQVPTAVAPTEVVPTEVVSTAIAPTEVVPTEVVSTAVAPTEVAPTEVAPTGAAPTEAAPTEAAPTEAAPTEEVPTEAAPVETAAPVPIETVPPVPVPTPPPAEAPQTVPTP